VAEFVGLKVDVIVTWASAQSDNRHPDCVCCADGPGFRSVVASLSPPGGNITGQSLQQTDTAGKRLELLREVVPGLRRLAIKANVSTPGAVLEMREVQATARALGLEVTTLEIRRAEDIPPAIEALETRTDGTLRRN
jgi:putative tryptophan/tyrosine transport system substrate-binding protein